MKDVTFLIKNHNLAKPRKSGQISPICRPGERCKGTSTSAHLVANLWDKFSPIRQPGERCKRITNSTSTSGDLPMGGWVGEEAAG